jgi:hypothetical protein
MIASTARKYGSQAMPRYMCTATYPLSRSLAVLRRASSAATVRTSSGNGTAKPRCGIIDSTLLTASVVRSRASAYSISVKRTSRGVAKIDAELSSRSELPASRVTSRFSRGISRGRARPVRHASSNA